MTRRLAVAKAYCSTANLGAGFDVFSLSLSKYSDIVRVQLVENRRVTINATGPYRKLVPLVPNKNSAGPPALELLRRARIKMGLEITVDKNVPPGLGLGSSGATAAACTKAVDDLLDLKLSDSELVTIASLGEAAVAGTAHADNVAASLLGGFTIVYGRSPLHVLSTKPPLGLGVVVVTPKVQLPKAKTKLARKLVPRKVGVEKAVLNIGRASALALGFARGDIDLIGEGMNDEIVEPYREQFISGYKAVKKAALASNASGVAISGAGPSVIALVDRTRVDPNLVARAMVREFSRNRVQASFFITRPSPGARVIRRA